MGLTNRVFDSADSVNEGLSPIQRFLASVALAVVTGIVAASGFIQIAPLTGLLAVGFFGTSLIPPMVSMVGGEEWDTTSTPRQFLILLLVSVVTIAAAVVVPMAAAYVLQFV